MAGASTPPSTALVFGLVDGTPLRGAAVLASDLHRSLLGPAAGWCALSAASAAATLVPGALVPAAAGWDHQLAVDAAGRVAARGWNAHGQADPGTAGSESWVDGWRPVAALADVSTVQVAAGERHSLALSGDGLLFEWGQRCGGGGCDTLHSPGGGRDVHGTGSGAGSSSGDERSDTACDYAAAPHSSGASGPTPAEGDSQQQQPGSPTALRQPPSSLACVLGSWALGAGDAVVMVAAGGRHSLALTRSGAVLAWGSNLQGQCGIDSCHAPVDVASPTLVAALGGVPIAAVAAGASHSVALSRDGAAYAWGCGRDGALGAGTADDGGTSVATAGAATALGLGLSSAVPLLVEAPGLDDEDVAQVACGAQHTLLRCASGAVYACGNNRYGAVCCCGGAAAPPQACDTLTGGLAHAWACRCGDAIHRPRLLRVQVPAAGGPDRRVLEAEPAAKRRLTEGVPVQCVYAGAWHSVLVV